LNLFFYGRNNPDMSIQTLNFSNLFNPTFLTF